MAGKPKPMSQVKQILRMHADGKGVKIIARSLGISKNTVKDYQKCRCGWASQPVYQNGWHKLENVVYFELLRRGGKVFVGKNNDKEIDFVVQKPNNKREYYQVAFTVNDEKTFNREILAFSYIHDNYPKYLLTLDFDNTNIDGIKKLNVIDWLLNEEMKIQY